MYDDSAQGNRRTQQNNLNPRFIGNLAACYIVRGTNSSSSPQTIACRVRVITPGGAAIAADQRAEIGQAIVLRVDPFGIVRATIVQQLTRGFAVQFTLSDEERANLSARIRWLKHQALHHARDHRRHKRILARHAATAFAVSDKPATQCQIIDMSASGVALNAPFQPSKGTRVQVGLIHGRVVRHFENGFAVEFERLQNSESLEALLTGRGPQRRTPRTRSGVVAAPHATHN